MPRDYYQILNVSRDASVEDIKKAYRRLSKELHPDKNKGDATAEQRFKEVNEAYEVLRDPAKRQRYDQFGAAGAQGFSGFGDTGGFDFSGFGGGLSDIFESVFGGGATRAQRSNQGRDREVRMRIAFDEAVHGAKKSIAFEREVSCNVCGGSGIEKGSKTVACPDCSGTGQVTRTTQSFFGSIQQSVLCRRCGGSGSIPERPCASCSGEGRHRTKETITVEVPAGIHNGQTLRLNGQGDAGRQGAPAGDLYVLIAVEEDPRFRRDGDDVATQVTVSVLDAILGAEVSVPTPHGSVELKIPAGTQPSQVLRLKGKGMPVLGTSRQGNLYVTVRVEIPSKLSKKEKELLEEWKHLR
ncbi:molecular chaperone DnaJ [Candidatus Peregrinibacteria bacterium CG10_big_fil_rev_8_21_14_0_10_55_24]|nr:MAG: molecular chaperone DnaJ [Candidatus Peregrinibacteria bacterium CG10_big_fil_rev_8_21_14_0_10_55_24]